MMQAAKTPNQSGFGLLDVVVGTALFAVALMAAAQLVLDTNNMRQNIEIRRLVSDRIDEQMKTVEVTPFNQILATHQGRGFPVMEDGGLNLEAPQGDADGIPGRILIEVPDPPNDPNELLDVTVMVEWSDRAGSHRQFLTRRISRIGGLQ